MNNKKQSKKIALCGIFAALVTVVLYLFGMTVLDLSIIILAAFVTMILVVEVGERMTWVYAAVTSTILLIILPSKIVAVEYTLFAAVYPILKTHFERLSAVPAMLVKISCLDSMLLVSLVLAQYVFMLGEDYFAFNLITLAVGTVFFVFVDLTLSLFISLYMVKLRKKFGVNKIL